MRELHPWQVSTTEAQAIQRNLASQVLRHGDIGEVRLVAGMDVSAPRNRGMARGAVVVLHYPELTLEEWKMVEETLNFPYIPGFLSFRELPIVLKAFEALSCVPDLIMADGQGILHPRRLGIAAHLGLLLDRPTVGCAKSLLLGYHDPVPFDAGAWAPVRDGDEVVGAALRTRDGKNPVYVSIGHKIDLHQAIQWTLRCVQGHRLPEPTRLAHLAAGGKLKRGANTGLN